MKPGDHLMRRTIGGARRCKLVYVHDDGNHARVRNEGRSVWEEDVPVGELFWFEAHGHGSGTINVEPRTFHQDKTTAETRAVTCDPWVYVIVMGTDQADERQRIRHRIAEELAAFMTGGPKPSWIANMERTDEGTIVGSWVELLYPGLDGKIDCRLVACGPMFDADPPNLNWQTRQDQEAKDARARLMDLIWNHR